MRWRRHHLQPATVIYRWLTHDWLVSIDRVRDEEGEPDEVEIVEVGEGDVALLLAALKRLNNGVYALKVTLDFLNTRVGTLQGQIKELEEALKSHLEAFQAENSRLAESVNRVSREFKEGTDTLTKNVQLSLDMFLEKLSGELTRLEDTLSTITQDVSAVMSKLKEVELVSTDAATAVKSDVNSLRGSMSNVELALNELSQRVTRLEESQLAALRQYSLELQEVSLKLTQVNQLLQKLLEKESKEPTG
ncbi:hypothetical protein Tpen_0801 [Thermofilum pendens Hrk 5]|uniref:Uncharacterized protein n=1 Tax=Thermofilum pendens (strain DSM 2475 / Hrk 5) TaxID=368408 RepID=A1RYC3_THEPD|nr:hypothetical protein Tpen_0801 [Thermofilum pendens Hrk 5]